MTAVQINISITIVQALAITLGPNSRRTVEVPLLVGASMAAVHVCVLVPRVIVQAFPITGTLAFDLLGLRIKIPLLIAATMTAVHVDILVPGIVIQALAIAFDFDSTPVRGIRALLCFFERRRATTATTACLRQHPSRSGRL